MESTLDLQVLTPDDWPLLKAARLDALKDSPHAFMSRYDVEWDRSEREWRRSIETATWIIARDTERAVGLARSVAEPARTSVCYLESIWVDPGHRRRGVFRALLHRLADFERHMGATELLLWVLEDNHTCPACLRGRRFSAYRRAPAGTRARAVRAAAALAAPLPTRRCEPLRWSTSTRPNSAIRHSFKPR